MPTIKPFRAIRPALEYAQDIAALPYDVYNREEAKKEIEGKPLSFLRVDRAETTLDDSVSTYAPEVYEQAKKNLNYLIDNGYLIQDADEAFYIYELTRDGKSQTGLVGVCSVDDYLDKTIREHEATRKDKEQDRVDHVNTLDCNTGPIFLTYKDRDDLLDLIESQKKEPLYDFVAEDQVRHRVYKIDNKEVIRAIEELGEDIDNFYIADGHHRAASAVRVAQMRREENPDYTGEEDFNYFLSVVFPKNELTILDYNRTVSDLNGLTEEEFLQALEKDFVIEEAQTQVRPERKGEFGLFLNDKWYKLTYKHPFPDDCVKSLDVSILYSTVLASLLGIGDVRTDKRIDFVGGIRGLDELERRAHEDMTLSFSMYPTGIDELLEVADNRRLMPPKSTWFEPKLRSGLFIHHL